MQPSAANNLHSRQPVLPHRRINRRPVSPFQAGYHKLDLIGVLAMAPSNGFEADSHRLIAFSDGDRVGRCHDSCFGRTCIHTNLHQCFLQRSERQYQAYVW